jgi:tRNA A58 N-methylase Trm61
MATDVQKIIQNLTAVFDPSGRTIIVVGGGGGQFIEYGRPAARILSLDSDAEAIRLLRKNLKKAGLEDRFAPILGDFYESGLKGDAVLFEFCLHEMSDPKAAIRHAQTMAPDIVVIDHWPDSKWSHYAAETEKVNAGWEAVESFPLKKKQSYRAVHFFNDYDELYLKLKDQGEISLARIEKFRFQKNIVIPIVYGIAVISG